MRERGSKGASLHASNRSCWFSSRRTQLWPQITSADKFDFPNNKLILACKIGDFLNHTSRGSIFCIGATWSNQQFSNLIPVILASQNDLSNPLSDPNQQTNALSSSSPNSRRYFLRRTEVGCTWPSSRYKRLDGVDLLTAHGSLIVLIHGDLFDHILGSLQSYFSELQCSSGLWKYLCNLNPTLNDGYNFNTVVVFIIKWFRLFVWQSLFFHTSGAWSKLTQNFLGSIFFNLVWLDARPEVQSEGLLLESPEFQVSGTLNMKCEQFPSFEWEEIYMQVPSRYWLV